MACVPSGGGSVGEGLSQCPPPPLPPGALALSGDVFARTDQRPAVQGKVLFALEGAVGAVCRGDWVAVWAKAADDKGGVGSDRGVGPGVWRGEVRRQRNVPQPRRYARRLPRQLSGVCTVINNWGPRGNLFTCRSLSFPFYEMGGG